MTELAAHLVDRVIPEVPVRQWVLSLPWSLRYLLVFDAALCGAVLAVFIRVVFGWLRRRAAGHGVAGGQGGAVTVIQRFGGALNANVHFHALVLDGVFTRPTVSVAPVFNALPPPTDDEIAAVLEQVHARVQRRLRRRGRLPEEPSPTDPVADWARREGFSRHANVALPAPARAGREPLCRYLLRPPRALELRRSPETPGVCLAEVTHRR